MKDKVEDMYSKEQEYLRAKERVKQIRDFYSHLSVYIVINLGISGVIIWGLMRSGERDLISSVTNFGAYATWIFWGIGVFFHWLKVFGFNSQILGKDWEARKIKELMKEDEVKSDKYFK